MSEKIEDTGIDRERSQQLLIMSMILIGVQVFIAAIAYTFVPDQLPMHWNALGQIDHYGPKLEVLCFPPLTSLGILIIVRSLVALGPYINRENKKVTIQFTDYMIVAIIVLMQVTQLVTIAVALHIPIDSTAIMFIATSLLFIGIGNYMGKLRRNFYAGIRTPWTVSDDRVWERTHRLGGWLFVAAGIIGLITAFAPPPIRIAGMIVPIVLVGVITVVYSYKEYHRLHSESF